MSDEIDVEVVRAQLAGFPDLRAFQGLLSGDELARAGAYRMAEPRDVFTLARGLLRVELSRRLGVAAPDLRFEVQPSGKPEVRVENEGDAPEWRFSVSHTGPHVAIAFARGVDIGVDIERIDRVVRPLEIATRYFAPDEVRSLEALPVEERERAFFAGWTRKEAIVKARGHTMAESLTTLSVDLDPLAAHPRSMDSASVPARPACRLSSFEFRDQNLIGAVALQSDRVPRLAFHVVSAATFD